MGIKLLNHRKTMVKNGLVNSLADAAKHIAEAQMELVNSGAAQNAAENVSKKLGEFAQDLKELQELEEQLKELESEDDE